MGDEAKWKWKCATGQRPQIFSSKEFSGSNVPLGDSWCPRDTTFLRSHLFTHQPIGSNLTGKECFHRIKNVYLACSHNSEHLPSAFHGSGDALKVATLLILTTLLSAGYYYYSRFQRQGNRHCELSCLKSYCLDQGLREREPLLLYSRRPRE